MNDFWNDRSKGERGTLLRSRFDSPTHLSAPDVLMDFEDTDDVGLPYGTSNRFPVVRSSTHALVSEREEMAEFEITQSESL